MIPSHATAADFNRFLPDTLMEHLGFEFTEIGTDYVIAKMPVDHRTHQPYGMLHGGASVALAESIGSAASAASLNPETHYAVGLEINANHIRPVKEGFVFGKATILHRGRNTHIWDIKITNAEEKLVCVCRLTMAILPKK